MSVCGLAIWIRVRTVDRGASAAILYVLGTKTRNGSHGPDGGPSVKAGIGYDFENKVCAGLTYVYNNYGLSDLNFSCSISLGRLWKIQTN